MRILGIDYGEKRVGLALGDTDSRIATPWAVLPNEGTLPLLAKIHEIVTRDLVEEIVIGVPRPLKDQASENQQVRAVREFAEQLKGLGLPIHEENEVLTSRLAAQQAAQAGERDKRDDLAAANILQTWLDRH